MIVLVRDGTDCINRTTRRHDSSVSRQRSPRRRRTPGERRNWFLSG